MRVRENFIYRKCHLVWRMLGQLGIKSAILHSFLTQKRRNSSLSSFKNQRVDLLLATDVAGRGIDVKSVDLVINYNLPRDHKDFVHRVGRAARGGKIGQAVSIVTQYDLNRVKAIEDGLNEKMEEEEIDAEMADSKLSEVIKAKKKAELDMSEKGETEIFQKLRMKKGEFRKNILSKRKPK